MPITSKQARLPQRRNLRMILDFVFLHPAQEAVMKPEIQPDYHQVTVNCSCGNSFKTRSTYGSEQLHIEVCAQCHPFFTGKQKMLDTAGQVDKFRRRYGVK